MGIIIRKGKSPLYAEFEFLRGLFINLICKRVHECFSICPTGGG